MMSELLPAFRYHPDPVATGSIVRSDATCRSCERARGYIYTGPAYAEEDLDDAFCPWCIADGSAADRFDAEFVDAEGIGDHDTWDSVSPAVVLEITRRTPGFNGWQQERWWTHCRDGAEFLGFAGRRELDGEWRGAIPALMKDVRLDGYAWEEYLAALEANGSPTAYIFRCRHCHRLGGYSDSH